MRQFCRNIFFWDAPEEGAFFVLNLVPASIWLFFSVWCGIMVVDYTLLLPDVALFSAGVCGLLVLLYSVVLLMRKGLLWSVKHQDELAPSHWWRRLWMIRLREWNPSLRR